MGLNNNEKHYENLLGINEEVLEENYSLKCLHRKEKYKDYIFMS